MCWPQIKGKGADAFGVYASPPSCSSRKLSNAWHVPGEAGKRTGAAGSKPLTETKNISVKIRHVELFYVIDLYERLLVMDYRSFLLEFRVKRVGVIYPEVGVPNFRPDTRDRPHKRLILHF